MIEGMNFSAILCARQSEDASAPLDPTLDRSGDHTEQFQASVPEES
jgi:hypothetical protein